MLNKSSLVESLLTKFRVAMTAKRVLLSTIMSLISFAACSKVVIVCSCSEEGELLLGISAPRQLEILKNSSEEKAV
jgi:hypothetical protein